MGEAMWQNKRISIVFPAYNEEPNIRRAVREFLEIPVVDEVIVVDNNSRDRTNQEAQEAGARVILETKQGYGNALRRGMAEASGDLIVLCEPDGTFEGRDLHKLLAYADDFDMVLGTRTTQELIWQDANMNHILRLGNLVVAKLLEFLFGGPSLSDCGCTFRLITRAAYQKIQPHLTVGGSHFLPELVIWGLLRQQRLIEIPVNYLGRVGESKITGNWKGIVKTGWAMFCLILWLRFKIFSYPEEFRKTRPRGRGISRPKTADPVKE